jgi:hypothetical protein
LPSSGAQCPGLGNITKLLHIRSHVVNCWRFHEEFGREGFESKQPYFNIGMKSRWTQQSVQMWSLKTSMEPLILTPNAQVPFTLLTYHLFTHHALLIYCVEEQVSIAGVHLEYFRCIWLSKYLNLVNLLKTKTNLQEYTLKSVTRSK